MATVEEIQPEEYISSSDEKINSEEDIASSDDEAIPEALSPEREFDTDEFDSNFPLEDFQNEEERNLYRSYLKQITESKGFDLKLDKPFTTIGGIIPFEKEYDPATSDLVADYTKDIVERNNKIPGRKKLKFVQVEKFNIGLVSGKRYYVTFLAEDDSGIQDLYQTMFYKPIFDDPIQVMVLRKKPQKD